LLAPGPGVANLFQVGNSVLTPNAIKIMKADKLWMRSESLCFGLADILECSVLGRVAFSTGNWPVDVPSESVWRDFPIKNCSVLGFAFFLRKLIVNSALGKVGIKFLLRRSRRSSTKTYNGGPGGIFANTLYPSIDRGNSRAHKAI
jgi:hypothetical protein